MMSKLHSNSTQMVYQGLPEKIVQFDRDHLVNIDCSMLSFSFADVSIVLPSSFLSASFSPSVTRARKPKRFMVSGRMYF